MVARFRSAVGVAPWLVAAALVLTGCADLAPKKDRVAPIVLSYPYGESGPYLFADYDRIVASAARSYVAITIRADRETAAESAHDLVNAASGTIIDSAGYIVTASHIAVDTKYHAEVTTIDGRVHRGKILRVDRDRELALIEIPPVAGLVAARFADSSRLVAGGHAAAIGSPRHLNGGVALGLIKEPLLGRPMKYNGYTMPNVIVIAMAAEPGHSGGPVFDENGELIGMIASFGLGDTRKVPYVSPRIAFAVPSNDIAAYLQEVIAAR